MARSCKNGYHPITDVWTTDRHIIDWPILQLNWTDTAKTKSFRIIRKGVIDNGQQWRYVWLIHSICKLYEKVVCQQSYKYPHQKVILRRPVSLKNRVKLISHICNYCVPLWTVLSWQQPFATSCSISQGLFWKPLTVHVNILSIDICKYYVYVGVCIFM